MAWVLAHGPDTAPVSPALSMEGPVIGHWPVLQTTAVSPELEKALRENAATQAPANAPVPVTWLLAMLGAFVGGMILNLMPCVFPVLAIKVMGFARPADHPGAHARAGVAYTLGVVLSFVALGGLLLLLRATGCGYGFGSLAGAAQRHPADGFARGRIGHIEEVLTDGEKGVAIDPHRDRHRAFGRKFHVQARFLAA